MGKSQENSKEDYELDRELESSETEPESTEWDEYSDRFLDKPPYLTEPEEVKDVVAYSNRPYQHSTRDAPDLFLALASAIEFITSKLSGADAYLVKEKIFKFLISVGLLRPEYLSDEFADTRTKFILLLSNLTSSINRGMKLTLNFSPSMEAPLSVTNGTFTVGPSRYYQDFEEIKCIGKGGFGKVFKVRSKIDEQFYAIKKIRLRKIRSRIAFEKMVNECRLHASLISHPHLLRYHNAWIECDNDPSTSKMSDCPPSSPKEHMAIVELTEDAKIETIGVSLRRSRSTSSSDSDSSSGGNKFWRKPKEPQGSPSPFTSTESPKEDELDLSKTQESTHASGDTPRVANKALAHSISTISLPEPNYSMFHPVLHIQMELCETTLEKYLESRNDKQKPIDEEFSKKVVRSLLSGLTFLHKHSIIHRDIKPSNIFLKKHKDGFHVLLGDFGLATDKMTPSEEDRYEEPAVAYKRKLSSGIGTYSYASPEQLNTRFYDSKTDIYSCGVVIYELYSQFRTSMERKNSLKLLRATSTTPMSFQDEHPIIASMINNMVRADSSNRLNAEKLLKIFDRKLSSRRSQLSDEVQALKKENKELKNRNAALEEELTKLRMKYEALEEVVRLQSGT